ncbi:glycosyltransferase [uncultured Psychroserpens sp.]|uniref:glycosyltransferase n=1 Tax=uncultured Psychroserpens sp. TaxID=255436 RepID=UPI00262A559F|nr:glycosyltransferase [uncultured Psychroserpens sp.]
MSLKINIFFRKRQPQYNSIEELFLGLKPILSKYIEVDTAEVPFYGGHPKAILKNIKWARTRKSTVNHITGDIHYVALAFGKSSVLTIHDIKSALKGNLIKQIYVKLFWFWLPALFVKRITVISNFTKLELSRIIPFAKHKIRVVYNPVNPKLEANSYEFNHNKPKLLFVGTKANKNLERSLEAIKDLTCEAIIVGPISEDQQELLERLEIEYYNHNDLTFDEIIECYKASDLVCFASTYEGFGMPIIEAQAIGRPVITSNIGAMVEISNESTSLVNPYDKDAIKQAVEKICNDGNYREALIKKGFANIKRFYPEQIAKAYISVYKEVAP